MKTKIDGIVQSAQNMNSISTIIRNGMSEITEGISELSVSVQDVSAAGNVNAENIKLIESMLARFTLIEEKEAPFIGEETYSDPEQDQIEG